MNNNYEEQFENYLTLDDSLFELSSLEESKISSNLAGSPTKMWKDILLRFFKNYISVIALIVFIVILLMSLLVPVFSPYYGNLQVTNAEDFWNKSLPPMYAPIATENIIASIFNTFFDPLGISGINLNDGLSESEITTIINGSNGIIHNISTLPINSSFLVTYDKYQMLNLILGQENKSMVTFLGTNSDGFDVWTRTWAATQESLLLSLLVVGVESLIGVILGSYLGFFAGTWIDNVFTRFVDVIRNIPTIIWFLMFMSFFREPNFWTMFFALTLVGWTYPVYLTRIWIITVKDSEFIKASRSIGAKTNRLVFVHALPLIIGKLATSFVTRIISVIFLVASLSFLGFIPASDAVNLGRVLQESIGQASTNIWVLLLPSLVLLFLSLSAQFIANGIHDALDPKTGKGGK